MDGEAIWRKSLEKPLEAPRRTKKNFCQECSLVVKPDAQTPLCRYTDR